MSTSSSVNTPGSSTTPKTKLQLAKEFLQVMKIVKFLNDQYPAPGGEKKFVGIYYPTGKFWDISCNDYDIWQNPKYKNTCKTFMKLKGIKLSFTMMWGGAVDIEIKWLRENQRGNLITLGSKDRVYYAWAK